MRLLFVFLFISFGLNAQEVEFLKIKKYRIAVLSDSIQENSGLSFLGDKLYTINDSGNTADIFEIDKNSGRILKTFKTKFTNKDWEAVTNNGDYLYVGDFGNNAGNRNDLKIFKIPSDSVFSSNDFQEFSFYYPEQTDFSSQNLDTDFDCEAMIFLSGNLHLFTKEWKSKKVTHYLVNPYIIENQPAQKLENFDVGFSVTDASYFEKKLYLVGYTKKMEVFLSIFDEDKNGMFFNSTPKKHYLGQSSGIGQIEGIAVNKDGIYISGERFKFMIFDVAPSLYFIPFEKNKSLIQ